MENKKEENHIDLEEEYPFAVSPFAASPFCEEYLPPPPPTVVTVQHKTVGGKGVVGRLGK
jgi:hypothetical protein